MKHYDIDMDAVMRCAVTHMDAENDLRWSVGMALEELYGDDWREMQKQMVVEWLKSNKGWTADKFEPTVE